MQIMQNIRGKFRMFMKTKKIIIFFFCYLKNKKYYIKIYFKVCSEVPFSKGSCHIETRH